MSQVDRLIASLVNYTSAWSGSNETTASLMDPSLSSALEWYVVLTRALCNTYLHVYVHTYMHECHDGGIMEYSRFKFCQAITRGTLITSLRCIGRVKNVIFFVKYVKKGMNDFTELREIAVNIALINILWSIYAREIMRYLWRIFTWLV